MQHNRLGHSDLSVPAFGLGCGPLGGMKMLTDADCAAVLATAWDAGVRHFDTAPWYGNTQSEHRVGQFLRGKPRDAFTVSTKVGRIYRRPNDVAAFWQSNWAKRWPGGLGFEPHFDYSYDGIMRSYEDSLGRLGLSSVDALAIHDLDIRHRKNPEGVALGFDQLERGGYRALSDLKARGEIKAIGAGINFPGLIPQFLARFDIDYFILAMPYTLLDQTALQEDLPLCAKAGASVLIGAPFASGILATGAIKGAQYAYGAADQDILDRVRELERIGRDYDVPLAAAALQLPLAHPDVAGVIPGAETADHIRANLAALSHPIPAAYWRTLRDKKLLVHDTPVPVDK